MIAQSAEQVEFEFVPGLPVVVQRHNGQLTSDAGLLPVREFDEKWKYTSRMADGLAEGKPERKQSLLSMLRQRVFGIVAGYEDCNDHDDLRHDPVFKLIADDRRPDGNALASQPTLSRFENDVTDTDFRRLVDFHVATGVERLVERHGGSVPASVTLDLDATDDPTHGSQQLTLFHGYYGQYQYYPLIVSEPTTRHVFIAQLRHGTAAASLGADDDLMKVVAALRAKRPGVAVHVRGDSGFGLPLMYDLCEANGLTYTLGFSSNGRLKKLTQGLMQRAKEQFERTGEKARLFECFQYQCDNWPHARTVVAKAECHAGGTNLRFVVTNLPDVVTPEDGQRIYDEYIMRGESEHRMDELKNGLSAGRLSCHRFKANFFRLLVHAAAYNLTNALRDHPSIPHDLKAGQPDLWRRRVIKVAAEVIATTRRIIVRLAAQWPHFHAYRAVAARASAFGRPVADFDPPAAATFAAGST
jgi:hypothetical protein